ncbi:MAG TPA: hypothetical protein VMD99_02275 [Terriglobales bacterium]|nr:hypothetical protein [Terriglobales bacterium]
MKNIFPALALVALGLTVASAKDSATQGTIVSENSVPCGSQAKGKKTSEMMCQEYVIRTATTDYHVRQEKEAHKEILPISAPVELSLSKDRMKFKVNGKSFEMLIVSEAAAPAPGTAAPVPPTTSKP